MEVIHHTGKHGQRYQVDRSHANLLHGLLRRSRDRTAPAEATTITSCGAADRSRFAFNNRPGGARGWALCGARRRGGARVFSRRRVPFSTFRASARFSSALSAPRAPGIACVPANACLPGLRDPRVAGCLWPWHHQKRPFRIRRRSSFIQDPRINVEIVARRCSSTSHSRLPAGSTLEQGDFKFPYCRREISPTASGAYIRALCSPLWLRISCPSQRMG